MRIPPAPGSAIRDRRERRPIRGIAPQACVPQTPFCINGRKEYRCCDWKGCRSVWMPCTSEVEIH